MSNLTQETEAIKALIEVIKLKSWLTKETVKQAEVALANLLKRW